MNTTKLYSWVDVDAELETQRLKGQWPKGLVRASAYYDGLSLSLNQASAEQEVSDWLSRWFMERYEPGEDPALLLEAAVGQQRKLPVFFEVEEEESARIAQPTTLTWRRLALLPDEKHRDPKIPVQCPSPFPEGTPPIVAFYSFKGGVGRTVHLCALFQDLWRRKQRVLLIDADLEAPGLSVLAEKEGRGVPEISLVDVLALAHGEASSGWPSTLSLCVQKLRSQPLRFGGTEHYLLPTYRHMEQALLLDVRPEHLTQTPQTAWRLGDLFAALGKTLNVDVILIDLRAGLSEMASSLLFDSRLHRVLVTTLGVQSRLGTQLVLRELGKLLPPDNRVDLFDPEVILSMLNSERMDNESRLAELRNELENAYPAPPAAPTIDWDGPPARLEITPRHQTRFYDALLNAETLSDLFVRMNGGLGAEVHELVEQEWKDFLLVPPKPPEPAVRPPSASQAQQDRDALIAAAKRLEYAERTQAGVHFLVTRPLQNLAQAFEVELPRAVVLGPKGAGKTFLFLNIVAGRRWSAFVEKTLGRKSPVQQESLIWPLSWPRTTNSTMNDEIKSCARDCRARLGLSEPSTWELSQLRERLDEEKSQGSKHETVWQTFWFSVLADSLGVPRQADEEPARALAQFVKNATAQLVVVMDGLEELFPNIRGNETEQVALRALLQGVPERLGSFPDKPLGLLVVVRDDVAASAIRQNFGQFRSSYEPYALRWDAEESLRLALWLALDAKVSVFSARELPMDRMDQLISYDLHKHLVELWGYKLGPQQSREARSTPYVLSALADFQGRIQARDMVRLILKAAEQSRASKEAMPLLIPSAMRKAPDFCGVEKLRELLEEVVDLEGPVKKLRENRKAEERSSPFDPAAFQLTADEVQHLESTGLVKKQGEKYVLAELLRRGLGFAAPRGRPKILGL